MISPIARKIMLMSDGERQKETEEMKDAEEQSGAPEAWGPNAPLFALATKATKLGELLWIVDSSACKVKPLGLALIAKKQLVVKAGESLEL